MSSQAAEHALAPTIEEVVTSSSNAEFRNDVQIRQFWTDNNLELARDYIFTSVASVGSHSSIHLLKLLCEAFMPGAPPNRFVFIATYGHGKSHFGVATANFFGRRQETPEFEGVFSRIKHAVQDESTLGFFQAFKRNNPRHLIVILPGDEPSDLQTKFFRAVDAAIQHSGKEVTLPFWYAEAEKFVEDISLNSDLRDRANQFLAKHGIDNTILLDRIKKQQASTYEITRGLCQELFHHNPDFGSGIGLKEAVEWLGNNLVGPGKPFSGILILFDEFSAFVRDYALKYQHRPGAPLQDLLNGIETMRGKVAFVALAQRDPELIAKSLISNGDSLRTLITELNRLPRPQHYQLHSSLEEVLAAYLKQNQDGWRRLFSISKFLAAFGHASDLGYETFQQRYQDTLKWDLEHFQEIVAQGCFPLHPSTTALLSSVEFESTSNPRSVLGFVSKHLEKLHGTSSWDDGKPCWVLPIALVEYFGEMLGAKLWSDYSDAVVQAGGPDTPRDELAVLKAMLLQLSGKVATRGAYDRVIAEFSGLTGDRAVAALQSLANKGVIQRHQSQRTYTFWPAGRGANKVDQILSQKIKTCTIGPEVLDSVTRQLKQEGQLQDIPVSVSWGHREDWYAEQLLFTKDTLSIDTLQRLVISRLRWRPDCSILPRGLVLWFIADTPETVAWLQDCASDILERAFPGQRIPIVIMKPVSARPDLQEQLIRFHCLGEFSNSEIADVGHEQLAAQKELVLETLKTALKSLAEEAEMEVAVPFKGHMERSRPATAELALGELFPMAYSKGPRKWFQQYKQAQLKLRNSTGRVMTHLLNNSIYVPNVLDADSVARDIAFEQLKANWFILGADLRITQPPARSAVRDAWDLLESTFPAGGQPKLVSGVVAELFSYPYGFDWNTLALLLSAWCGFYRHDLEVSIQGQLRPISTFRGELKPKDFIEQIAGAMVRRMDSGVLREKIQVLLRRLDRESFTQSEATEAKELLSQALDRDDLDERAAIEGAIEKLRKGIQAAEAYDAAANRIEISLGNNTTLNSLIEIHKQISGLQVPRFVLSERPVPSVLFQTWLAKVKDYVESQCQQRRILGNLSDYSLNHEILINTKKVLDRLKISDLIEVVDAALKDLSESKERFEHEQREQASLAIIDSTPLTGPMQKLRENLSKLNEIELHLERNRTVQQSKVRAIELEIARLENFQKAIPTRLSAASDLATVEEIQSDLLRSQNLFEGTSEASELHAGLSQCTALRVYFSSIDEYRKREFNTPAAADQITMDLKSLLLKHESVLSEVQKQVAASAFEHIKAKVEESERQCIDWLAECEQQFSNGTALNELSTRLFAPPAFLPGDQQPRLEALRDLVQKRVEALQQESAVSVTLKNMVARGSVERLRAQIKIVEGLESPTEAIRIARGTKLSELRDEIARLEAWLRDIPARLDAALDLQNVEQIQGELLRNQNLFEGVPEADELQARLSRCVRLRSYFRLIEEYGKRDLLTPAAADQAIADLNLLLVSYDVDLSETHNRAVKAAIERVVAEVNDRTRKAENWLHESEQQANQGFEIDNLAKRLLSPPTFLPNEQRVRVETLLERVQQLLGAKQQEKATLAALSNLSAKGNLLYLRGQLEAVQAFASLSDETRSRIGAKISELQSEIARLDTFAKGIAARLDAVVDLRGLQQIQDDLLRNQNLFDGTPEADALKSGLSRCEDLRLYFASIEELMKRELKTPGIAAETIAEMEKLAGTEVGNCAQHHAVALRAIETTAKTVDSLSGIAREWLQECQSRLDSDDDPVELSRRLSSPPPFLPTEFMTALETLSCKVNERIDHDEVLMVVTHFKKIADRTKRLDCLEQLTAMAKEGQ